MIAFTLVVVLFFFVEAGLAVVEAEAFPFAGEVFLAAGFLAGLTGEGALDAFCAWLASALPLGAWAFPFATVLTGSFWAVFTAALVVAFGTALALFWLPVSDLEGLAIAVAGFGAAVGGFLTGVTGLSLTLVCAGAFFDRRSLGDFLCSGFCRNLLGRFRDRFGRFFGGSLTGYLALRPGRGLTGWL